MELQFHRLSPESEKDVNNLKTILSAAPGYYFLLEGKLPAPDAAFKELKEVPPGKSEYDKYFYGVQLSGKYIGCFDLVRNYPDSKTAFIGLLLLIESEQNKSYGVQVLQFIKSLAKQWGCIRLRLGVIEKNQRALAFWKREGFLELCKQPYKQYSFNVIIMEYAMVEIEYENEASIIRTKVG